MSTDPCTSGEWVYQPEYCRIVLLDVDAGDDGFPKIFTTLIADVGDSMEAEVEANGYLIAAAKDLRDALRMVLDTIHLGNHPALQVMQAALDKSVGKS